MIQTKNSMMLLFVCLVCACLLIGLFAVLFSRTGDTSTNQTIAAATTQTQPAPPAENVFTPTDFAYEGDYLSCITATSVLGIDVSTHQKEIDYQRVKAAGIEFVMIRLAWRGSVQGIIEEDEWAQKNYQNAKAAGLKVGGYFFSQAISAKEAREEATFALKVVKNWDIEMPIVFDWEFLQKGYRTDAVDARLLTDCTKAFCETVEKAGYDSMVYFNPSQSRKQMYLEELTDYGFWLAMYSDQMNYEYKVDMWQYSCTGKVPGIDGNVDLNLYFPYDEEFT